MEEIFFVLFISVLKKTHEVTHQTHPFFSMDVCVSPDITSQIHEVTNEDDLCVFGEVTDQGPETSLCPHPGANKWIHT